MSLNNSRFLLLLPALLILSSCGGDDPPKKAETVGAETRGGEARGGYDTMALAQWREAKDVAFRGDGSPIDVDYRASFGGLRYYPANPALVFNVPLERLPEPESISLAESDGGSRSAKRIGSFSFTVEGTPCRLAAYHFDKSPESIFLPFRDVTNGTDSYAAGRYIDLDVHEGDTLYQIDFNYAYNPYCAYSDHYICPRVPPENLLPVAIRAGEMTPDGGHR